MKVLSLAILLLPILLLTGCSESTDVSWQNEEQMIFPASEQELADGVAEKKKTKRPEEPPSEPQSHHNPVCRLLLEKKKKKNSKYKLMRKIYK